MPFSSEYAPLDYPQTDILSYLFGHDSVSDKPLWINSSRPSRSLTSKQALQWAKRLAFGLERLGLSKGDVILTCTPNHIFLPVSFLASAGGGFVFTGVNPTSTAHEIAYQISNSTAKVILAHPSVLGLVLEAAGKVGVPLSRIFQFSDENNPSRQGVEDWITMIGTSEQGDAWQWAVLGRPEAAETIATINYSSGTTGLPKGVCVSHANLITSVEQHIFMWYLGTPYERSRSLANERWIAFLPLYHAYGQLILVLMAAKLRSSVYVMAEFVFERYLDLIARHQISALHIVPPVLIMLSKRPEVAHRDFSSVKAMLCGGAPLSLELQLDCQEKFGVPIRQAWGMTECTCACAMMPGGAPDRSGSIGKLMPNCETKIIDDAGRELELGQRGEICIRGPNVTLGYWRNEVATRETIDENGWLKTGDIGTCNKDGFIWIVDRKKELIKVNAFQVAPAELEATLLENEHVADAAVVGMTLGDEERPRAYVVIQGLSQGKISPGDIKNWIASRVAKHKRLEGGVVFVDEIPKLASGKIKRKTMRERAKRDAAELQKRKSAKFGARL